MKMDKKTNIRRILFWVCSMIILILYIKYSDKIFAYLCSLKETEEKGEYFSYTQGCDDRFRQCYALQRKLYDLNGKDLFKETEQGSLASLYRKLNIKVMKIDDIIDMFSRPYYYMGSNCPPAPFKEKWGNFIVYAWGFDKKRDTYFVRWREMYLFEFGRIDGDYIVYSDKRDFNRFKQSCNKDNFDFMFDHTNEVIKIQLHDVLTSK